MKTSGTALMERLVPLCVLLCLLLGAALRFHGAGDKSFNSDEINDVFRSRDLTDVVVFRMDSEVSWLPAGYMLLSLASRVGSQDFILRFPSVACGILTLPVIYQLGRRMFGRWVGLVALFLAAISPFYVAYSQIIRHYPYFSLTSALVYYFLHRAAIRGKTSDWIGLAVSVSLSLRTHHIARVLVITQAVVFCALLIGEQGAHWAHRLFRRGKVGLGAFAARSGQTPLRVPGVRWLGFALCQVLIYLLSYWYISTMIYDISVAVQTRISPPLPLQSALFPEPVSPSPPPARFTRALVVNLLDTFSDGNWYDKMAVQDLGLFVGLWLTGVLAACVRRRWRQLLLVGSSILMPLIALQVMGVGIAHGLEARYFSFILPFYLIPIACGSIGLADLVGLAVRLGTRVRWLNFISSRFIRCFSQAAVVTAIAVPLGLFADRSVYSLRTWYRYEAQNWRDVAELATAMQADECIVSANPKALGYYLRSDYETCPSRDLAGLLTQYSGVWYVRLNYRPDQHIEQLVQDLGFATVRFDGHWGDGILVSHWRNDVPSMDLRNQLVTQAVEISPHDPSLRVNLAQVYFALGRVDEGIEQCRRALQMRPDYQPAYQMLVNHYLGQGQPEQAEVWIRRAFAHNRRSIWPYNLRGQYYQNRRMVRLAMDDFSRAIRLNPYETWNSYWRLAYLYRQLQRRDDLIALYQMAVRHNPDEPWAHLELARALRESGDLERAAAEYEHAVRLDPASSGAYLALAGVYKELGQQERIPALYQQASERNTRASWPLIALGDFYRDVGDPSSALAAYIRAYTLDQADSTIRQRIHGTRWNLADHLGKVHISSSSGHELIRGLAKIWYKPYPFESVVLVSNSPLTVSQQIRPAQVFFHPFSASEATSITFTVPSNPYLTLSTTYALADSVTGLSNGVDYRVEASTDGGNSYTLLAQATVTQNYWLSRTVSLVPYWHRDVTFRLTSDARGDYAYDWLLITFELQPHADVWDLVTNAWQGSGQCGATSLPFNPRGFRYQNRWLIARSTLPVQGVTHANQVQFHPCSATEDTLLRFPLAGNPFATLVTSYGLADEAVGRSEGVEYTIAISSTLNPTPTLLFEARVTENEWRTAYVDLTPYQGQDATLLLSASAVGDEQYDWLQIELNLFPVPLPPTYADRQASLWMP